MVRTQLHGSLEGVTAEQVAGLVIAYEPIWAIGTGKTATPADAQQMCAFVRDAAPRRLRRPPPRTPSACSTAAA